MKASQEHYCVPRDDEGPYTAVEVGYPSEYEQLLMPYVERTKFAIVGARPNLYTKVPANIIRAIIEKHAVIYSGQLPPLLEKDEDGCAWAAAAKQPTSAEDEGMSACTEAAAANATAKITGEIPPSQVLLDSEISPVEQKDENF